MARTMQTRRSRASTTAQTAAVAAVVPDLPPPEAPLATSRQYLHRTAKEHDISPYNVKQKLVSVVEDSKVTATNSAKSIGVKKKRSKPKPRKPRETKPKEETIRCMFCAFDKHKSAFPTTDDFPIECRGCAIGNRWGNNTTEPLNDHVVCFDCCRSAIDHYITDNYSGGPHCVLCHRPWDISALHPFTSAENIIRLEERMTNRHLQSEASFRWCAQDTCTAGQFYDLDAMAKNPKVCCGQCDSINCFECRVPWHEGMNCEEFQDPEVKKVRSVDVAGADTLKIMRSNATKRCPRCRVAVEKTYGCSHMACVSCGTNYSWEDAPAI